MPETTCRQVRAAGKRLPTFSLIPLLFNGLLVGMIVAVGSEGVTLHDRRGGHAT